MTAIVQSSPTKTRKPRSRKPQIPAEQLRDTFLSLPNDGLADGNMLASFLYCSPQTVEKMRLTGTGPKYAKLGRLVRYRKSDVLAWLDEQSRSSTSQG
jgi:predicted DNA-binding transcriptional regulator AlpA